MRAEVEAKKAAAARRKQIQTRTLGDAHVAGRVPRELLQRAKKSPTIMKTWVRSLEEPVRRYLVELEVANEEASSEDTEDEEIVFVGRNGAMRDGWKRARREGQKEEGLVLDDVGEDDESGAFKYVLSLPYMTIACMMFELTKTGAGLPIQSRTTMVSSPTPSSLAIQSAKSSLWVSRP